tara:strand:+ start:3245 stop:4663 length:1419 start_codon:yes stop_codon:yes gene_type:complete
VNFKKELKKPIFNIVSNIADNLNYPTFVVGGWVRDLILKRNRKNIDIDFVCVGSGIILAEKVKNELGDEAIIKIYKNFGTAMVSYKGESYEFVGARKESYTENSRKPITEDGTLEDDQKRRDFTINAMALQLNKNNFGFFLDPFNGVSDLNNKIIKTPLDPNLTFSDDPLRMMRAIRFANQLNFKIHPNTLKGIKNNSKRLNIISQERITDELNKIILSQQPSIGFKLLFENQLLQQFFEEFCLLKGVEKVNNHSHKDNFYHTLEVLDNISKSSNDLWLRWAAVLHDIAKPQTKKYENGVGWTFHAHEYIGSKMVKGIFKKLKLPLNQKMEFVKKMVALHLRPIVLAQEIVTDSAIRRLLFDAGDDIDKLMQLCDADITSKNPIKVRRYLANFQLVRKKLKEVEEKDKIRNFQPPVNGNEIMKMFNIKKGQEIGKLKKLIKDAILDGHVRNNKKDAILFLKNMAAELNIKKK